MALLASTAGEIAGAVATVIAAVLGLIGAYMGASAVRRQTTPEHGRGRDEPRRGDGEPRAEPAQRLDREVEGYVVRFLIFYLTLAAWNAFLNVVDPFVLFTNVSEGYYGDLVRDLVIGGVYVVLFLALGLPLLVDIYRRYGLRGGGRGRESLGGG